MRLILGVGTQGSLEWFVTTVGSGVGGVLWLRMLLVGTSIPLCGSLGLDRLGGLWGRDRRF